MKLILLLLLFGIFHKLNIYGSTYMDSATWDLATGLAGEDLRSFKQLLYWIGLCGSVWSLIWAYREGLLHTKKTKSDVIDPNEKRA